METPVNEQEVTETVVESVVETVAESVTLSAEGDRKDEQFSHYDDTELELPDTSDYKYTEIDCLNEDAPIAGQQFVLLSFVSPEGIMNCKVNGLMVRGTYATEQEAQTACEKLKKTDKYNDVFVGEVGKWLPWNPSSRQVEKVRYRNKKLDKIMQKVHESDMKSLNELVGRRKELLDKERTSHKNRIRESIKDSVDSLVDTSKEEDPEEKPRVKKSMRDAEAVKQRLRKTLENRSKSKTDTKAQKQQQQPTSNKSDQEKLLSEQKSQMQAESERISEKNVNISKLEQSASLLEEKLNKMKKLYEQRTK
jgi:hypothetical protein